MTDSGVSLDNSSTWCTADDLSYDEFFTDIFQGKDNLWWTPEKDSKAREEWNALVPRILAIPRGNNIVIFSPERQRFKSAILLALFYIECRRKNSLFITVNEATLRTTRKRARTVLLNLPESDAYFMTSTMMESARQYYNGAPKYQRLYIDDADHRCCLSPTGKNAFLRCVHSNESELSSHPESTFVFRI
jgi:hypothetical protein